MEKKIDTAVGIVRSPCVATGPLRQLSQCVMAVNAPQFGAHETLRPIQQGLGKGLHSVDGFFRIDGEWTRQTGSDRTGKNPERRAQSTLRYHGEDIRVLPRLFNW
jgi:hypothetical protein